MVILHITKFISTDGEGAVCGYLVLHRQLSLCLTKQGAVGGGPPWGQEVLELPAPLPRGDGLHALPADQPVARHLM